MLTVTDLMIVQTKVNAMPYKTDADRYGQPEFWEVIGQKGGDCEDFALAKLRHLLAMGMPAAQIDTDNLEADGLLKISSIVSALPSVTGGSLFVEYIDIHYQSSNVGTKNKAPNFHA